MENEALGSYRDFPAQRRTLEPILQKLSNENLPGKPYLEQYFRHMHRRDLTANTLRAAETSLRGFLIFLKSRGKTDLLTVVHSDLEAFVEGLQDRGLKPLGVENKLRQVKTFLRYLIEGGVISSEVLSRRLSIKVPKALPRALDPMDVQKLLVSPSPLLWRDCHCRLSRMLFEVPLLLVLAHPHSTRKSGAIMFTGGSGSNPHLPCQKKRI